MFGERLKTLREDRDLKQKDLAKFIGVSDRTIGMYEQERREPDFEILKKIADYFNVTVDYLLGRTDNPNIEIKDFEVDGDHYKVKMLKNNGKQLPYDLKPEQIKELLDQLEAAGFDVKKLVDKVKNK